MHKGVVHDDDGQFMSGDKRLVVARVHDQFDTAILETFGVNAVLGQFVVFKQDIVPDIIRMEPGTYVDLDFVGKLPNGPFTIHANPGSSDPETDILDKRWANRRSIRVFD